LRERPLVRLEFDGEAIEVAGWILVGIVASVLVVPLAWWYAAVCRWFCRNLRFSDGARAQFRGRGGEIFGWVILAILAGGQPFRFGPRIRLFHVSWDRLLGFESVNIDWKDPGLMSFVIAGAVMLWLVGVIGQLHIIRWCVAKTALSTDDRFRFHGAYWDLVGWELLTGLAALTIIGWAWTLAAAYRWAAGNTRSDHRALSFHGSGFEILWRTFGMAIFCVPIVTIPWALLWYKRWLVSQFRIGSHYAGDDD
jgi:hypothetical protein